MFMVEKRQHFSFHWGVTEFSTADQYIHAHRMSCVPPTRVYTDRATGEADLRVKN